MAPISERHSPQKICILICDQIVKALIVDVVPDGLWRNAREKELRTFSTRIDQKMMGCAHDELAYGISIFGNGTTDQKHLTKHPVAISAGD